LAPGVNNLELKLSRDYSIGLTVIVPAQGMVGD
jgi:hypothetical protein